MHSTCFSPKFGALGFLSCSKMHLLSQGFLFWLWEEGVTIRGLRRIRKMERSSPYYKQQGDSELSGLQGPPAARRHKEFWINWSEECSLPRRLAVFYCTKRRIQVSVQQSSLQILPCSSQGRGRCSNAAVLPDSFSGFDAAFCRNNCKEWVVL